MFCFDDSVHLAKAWGDMALAYMAAMSQIMLSPLQGSSVFSPEERDPELPATRVQGWSATRSDETSWYRAPERSPFEPSWLGLAWVMPLELPIAMRPRAMLGPFAPLEAWSKLLQASTPSMALGLPASLQNLHPMSWLTLGGLPIGAMPFALGMAAAVVGSTPGRSAPTAAAPQFATYRSESGHAVAQITFPNNLVAAVAVPENAASSLLDAFFPWHRKLH